MSRFEGKVEFASGATPRVSDSRLYYLKSNGDPLTRFTLKSIVTSTRSAILMKGMPLSMPNSLRSNAIVPLISPVPLPSRSSVKASVSGFETPRIVNVPGTSNVLGPVCTIFVE